MKFLTLLSSLALSSCGALAWSCLSDADAQSIIDRSIIFLEHPDVAVANATAQGLFADNVLELGDSINSLRGVTPGTVVFSEKQAYIAGTLGTPPLPTINTLASLHDCSRIVWYWEFLGVGTGRYRVRGMTLLTVDAQNKVIESQVEFNSLAWAIDIGYNVTFPKS